MKTSSVRILGTDTFHGFRPLWRPVILRYLRGSCMISWKIRKAKSCGDSWIFALTAFSPSKLAVSQELLTYWVWYTRSYCIPCDGSAQAIPWLPTCGMITAPQMKRFPSCMAILPCGIMEWSSLEAGQMNAGQLNFLGSQVRPDA